MHEEHKLISYGYTVKEAISICHAMRRDGTLDVFMQEQEETRHIMNTSEKEDVCTS